MTLIITVAARAVTPLVLLQALRGSIEAAVGATLTKSAVWPIATVIFLAIAVPVSAFGLYCEQVGNGRVTGLRAEGFFCPQAGGAGFGVFVRV